MTPAASHSAGARVQVSRVPSDITRTSSSVVIESSLLAFHHVRLLRVSAPGDAAHVSVFETDMDGPVAVDERWESLLAPPAVELVARETAGRRRRKGHSYSRRSGTQHRLDFRQGHVAPQPLTVRHDPQGHGK